MSNNSDDKSFPKGTIIGNISLDISSKENSILNTEDMLVLPTRNLILFPGISTPITIGRKFSLRVARTAQEKHLTIGIFCQKSPDTESPDLNDLYPVGASAEILEIIKLPDGNHVAIANAMSRIEITGKGEGKALPGSLTAKVRLLTDSEGDISRDKADFLMEEITRIAYRLIEEHSPERLPEFKFNLMNQASEEIKLAFVCTNLPFTVEEKYGLLLAGNYSERLRSLANLLYQKEELLNLSNEIKDKAKESMSVQQRNAFLANQMDVIKNELYGDGDDSAELMDKALGAHLPEKVMTHFEKEVRKLERLNPQSPDYAVLQTYLETLVSIPWEPGQAEPRTIEQAEKLLNKEHFGLEKVKERILEQLAMIIHNPTGKAPIICLVGPPGVGKTSLGESVAKALGREYQRISLGGMHDESEIRGHRRTYIGAMPGRIIDAMKKCKKTNPLLLLDEIDKLGKDYKGDPSSALLEVLDPEQNKTFHDNYVDVDYDLSNVLFICTANTTSTIPAPLLDRMEVIQIPGYLMEEKIEIARKHLIPRALKRADMAGKLKFKKDAIAKVIESYTAESGVRQLDKELSAIVRKTLLKSMRENAMDGGAVTVTPASVVDLLGIEKYIREDYNSDGTPGIVPGLAWTSVGGEMLYIEALLVPGKGERITLTGNLGDVMKESATIAWQVVRANADKLGISKDTLEKFDVHIHAPEGAVPKDGPSAGITIATAITSAYLGKCIKPGIAMTGEITLTGKVLPVGGIREKILAAKRVGINTIVLSSENKRHIEDIPEEYRKGMAFRFVNRFSDVISEVF